MWRLFVLILLLCCGLMFGTAKLADTVYWETIPEILIKPLLVAPFALSGLLGLIIAIMREFPSRYPIYIHGFWAVVFGLVQFVLVEIFVLWMILFPFVAG